MNLRKAAGSVVALFVASGQPLPCPARWTRSAAYTLFFSA